MTELFRQAVEATRKLPDPLQDEIARAMLALAGEFQPIVTLTPQERASFTESLAQSKRREFASDEEIAAVWAKHGL